MFISEEPWSIMRMVDVVVGESGEDGGGCAVAGRHVVPDGGDEGKPAVDVDAVGTERVAELVNELLARCRRGIRRV